MGGHGGRSIPPHARTGAARSRGGVAAGCDDGAAAAAPPRNRVFPHHNLRGHDGQPHLDNGPRGSRGGAEGGVSSCVQILDPPRDQEEGCLKCSESIPRRCWLPLTVARMPGRLYPTGAEAARPVCHTDAEVVVGLIVHSHDCHVRRAQSRRSRRPRSVISRTQGCLRPCLPDLRESVIPKFRPSNSEPLALLRTDLGCFRMDEISPIPKHKRTDPSSVPPLPRSESLRQSPSHQRNQRTCSGSQINRWRRPTLNQRSSSPVAARLRGGTCCGRCPREAFFRVAAAVEYHCTSTTGRKEVHQNCQGIRSEIIQIRPTVTNMS